MNVVVEIIGIEEIVSRAMIELDRGVTEGVRDGADLIADEARAHHDYEDRSGDLTGSIAAEDPEGGFFAAGVHADVKADAAHSAVIERGSKAHVIEPRRKKALRFTFGVGGGHPGIGVFARRVNHPGTKPYRFMAQATERRFDDAADAVFTGALESLRDCGFSIER